MVEHFVRSIARFLLKVVFELFLVEGTMLKIFYIVEM